MDSPTAPLGITAPSPPLVRIPWNAHRSQKQQRKGGPVPQEPRHLFPPPNFARTSGPRGSGRSIPRGGRGPWLATPQHPMVETRTTLSHSDRDALMQGPRFRRTVHSSRLLEIQASNLAANRKQTPPESQTHAGSVSHLPSSTQAVDQQLRPAIGEAASRKAKPEAYPWLGPFTHPRPKCLRLSDCLTQPPRCTVNGWDGRA